MAVYGAQKPDAVNGLGKQGGQGGGGLPSQNSCREDKLCMHNLLLPDSVLGEIVVSDHQQGEGNGEEGAEGPEQLRLLVET